MRKSGGILEVDVNTVEIDTPIAAFHCQLSPGSYIRLKVRDTGVGIPADTLERIFEPFFTTKGIGEGTGMGLAIVHAIVTSYGGALSVESRPGNGTSFTLYLPQIDHDSATAGDRPEHVMSQVKGYILFVDDEEMLARLGQVQLEELGYEVASYTSSVDALAVFRAAPDRFDVVITDQTMPEMTGEQLARELRQCRPDIPIIFMHGFQSCH